jgi:hypothetical protein
MLFVVSINVNFMKIAFYRLTNEFEVQIDELLSTVGPVTRRLFHVRCLTAQDDPRQSIEFTLNPCQYDTDKGNCHGYYVSFIESHHVQFRSSVPN